MQTKTVLAALCAACALAGCATQPLSTTRDPRDRFERVNRSIFVFNQQVDRAVARPIARAYVAVTPRPVRSGVSNFLANLSYPGTIVNDVLQGKFVPAIRDTGRLLVNTTVGIGGLFDPATKWGLMSNNEDFGQTLGRWGFPAGTYLMLPLLGPASVRDGVVGRVGDWYTEPRTYVTNDLVKWGLFGMDLVDTRAALLDADSVMQRSFDPYVFVRNAYLQRREYLMKDGNVEMQFDEEPVDPQTPVPIAQPPP